MLDDEQTLRWLVIPALVGAVWLYRAAGKRGDRRRLAWFDSVAAAFGSRAEHPSEFLSRFDVRIVQGSGEVAWRYRSRIGERLIMSVPLKGVSDIYNLGLKLSGDGGANGVRVRNSGFAPREGWLNAGVRNAMARFYEVAPHDEGLDVEGGALVYQTADRLEGSVARERFARLLPVANALERSL